MSQRDQLDAEAKKILDGLNVKGTLTARDRAAIPQQPMPSQSPDVRVTNTEEVALGYTEAMARVEAMRCLHCDRR